MCLSFHPHNIGRPNAAKYLDQALRYILRHDGVWNTTPTTSPSITSPTTTTRCRSGSPNAKPRHKRVPSRPVRIPGLQSVAIFEEIRRRHPEIGAGVRPTLERRIRV